ncbi:MAG: alpha/beta fold hydrolase [Hyphomicrobiales bacterium]
MVYIVALIVVIAVAGLVVLAQRADKAGKLLKLRYQRTGTQIEIDGGTLNMLDLGPPQIGGPPLVLIHDSGANHNDLKISIGERLARDSRVIIVDRPGSGWSDQLNSASGSSPEDQAVAIAQGLEKLGARNPVVIGHGTGAAVALAFALSYPEDLAGLILVAPVAFPGEAKPEWLQRLAALPLVGPALASITAPVLGPILQPRQHEDAFSPQSVPDGFSENTAAPLRFRTTCFVGEARDLTELDKSLAEQSRFYREIRVPTVLISADQDQIANSQTQADRLARDIPDMRHVVLNGAGHMAHHISPNVIEFEINRLAERMWRD